MALPSRTDSPGAPGNWYRWAGVVWFRRDWLQRLGLDPTQCAVLRVQGESMAPAIAAGSSTLVDRRRARRRDGQIFVLRTAEGMVARRATRSGEGSGWQLVSDHPAWEPVVFPEDAVILGRVVWTARALVWAVSPVIALLW